jgi:hypothetical protein
MCMIMSRPIINQSLIKPTQIKATGEVPGHIAIATGNTVGSTKSKSQIMDKDHHSRALHKEEEKTNLIVFTRVRATCK